MIRTLFTLFLLGRLSFAEETPPYLEQLVRTAEQSFAKEVPDKAAWLTNRDRYRRELKEMLGLDPEPARGDLKPVVTGTLTGDGIAVEKVHFQSLPGLYVTANLYRPAAGGGKLPTILYLCGHGTEMGPDGRSNGNKTHYQHHGVWFAQHGYNALLIDTVQLGEIMGDHHGTYKFNRWWWVSRGYTPAGVETWAGVRALDYLASRPDVDMERIGVTGRSGGGAYTWFLTAVDERVKVAAPTAGITTLRDHVINGVIDGHCDCMFMVNLYGWDFDKLAALTAPRPLLISNTDKDNIFPLGGVLRIYDSTRRLYKLLDAEKDIGLQISEGPHKDTQPLNAGAFHWFERFFKGADPMAVIKEPAVPAFKKEDLRVFAELPKDEINTKIDETFVPAANPAVPQTKEEWEKMRDGWLTVLRERVFKDIPAATQEIKYESGLARQRARARRDILAGKPYEVRVVESLANAASRELQSTPFYVRTAEGEGAVLTLFEFLLSKDNHIVRLELKTPPPSFRQGPVIPAILKYLDVPQLVAMAAERREVQITGRREDWTWALQTAEKMGFGSNLKIVPAMEVLAVKKVWDTAPHNAFTSLTEYKDEWFITFRESTAHVPGTDGAVRVLVSKDGNAWESAALLTEAGVDLRDPKFCTAPDGRLMLTIGGSIYDGASAPGAKRKRTAARTRTAFSTDGRTWTAPLPACDDGQWLWRVTARPSDAAPFDSSGKAFPLYGVAYTTGSRETFALSLWSSPDGAQFSRVAGLAPGRNIMPNETTVRFDDDGTMLALVRNENQAAGRRTMLGTSKPPYKEWSWTDTGRIIHGPDFIRLKDGRMIYSGRDYVDGKANTTVGFLTENGQALPMVVLPSGGDCSYPGLAGGPGGQLFISYYSSHEGKASIYFARLKMTE